MTLPPANENITVYRGGATANPPWGCGRVSPYPPDGTVPVFSGSALVKHHMKNGRFGKTGANVHWTHKMFIALADLRDPYSAQMTAGLPLLLQGDSVLIGDYPLPGRC